MCRQNGAVEPRILWVKVLGRSVSLAGGPADNALVGGTGGSSLASGERGSVPMALSAKGFVDSVLLRGRSFRRESIMDCDSPKLPCENCSPFFVCQ